MIILFNKLFSIIKKIIMSFLIIYGYNALGIPNSLVIPINIITLLFVYNFNFVGLFGLILFKSMFFV